MGLRRIACTAVLLASALSTSGCVSYWRGKEIDSDIAALNARMDALTEAQREAQKKQLALLQERLTELETRLTDAISQLQRGSADAGLELDKLREELRQTRGELEAAKQKAAQQENTGVVVATPPGAPPLPTTDAELYAYGYDRHKAGDWDEAVRALNEYATKFPGSERADNALYLMSEALSSKKDFAQSSRGLQTILQKYPKGDKVDDAYVLMHDNFVALGQCKNAIPFLETLISDQPTSNRVADAKKKLAQTKKGCR
jgi:TolA-binding protein